MAEVPSLTLLEPWHAGDAHAFTALAPTNYQTLKRRAAREPRAGDEGNPATDKRMSYNTRLLAGGWTWCGSSRTAA